MSFFFTYFTPRIVCDTPEDLLFEDARSTRHKIPTVVKDDPERSPTRLFLQAVEPPRPGRLVLSAPPLASTFHVPASTHCDRSANNAGPSFRPSYLDLPLPMRMSTAHISSGRGICLQNGPRERLHQCLLVERMLWAFMKAVKPEECLDAVRHFPT